MLGSSCVLGWDEGVWLCSPSGTWGYLCALWAARCAPALPCSLRCSIMMDTRALISTDSFSYCIF